MTNQIIKQAKKNLKGFQVWQEDEYGGFKCSLGSLNNFEELWTEIDQAITQAVEEERTRISKVLTGKGFVDFEDIFNNKLTK